MSAVKMTPSPETAPLLGRRETVSAWPRKTFAGICAVAGCVALAAAAKHGALGDAASVASQKLGQAVTLGRYESGEPQFLQEYVSDLYKDLTDNVTTSRPLNPVENTGDTVSFNATDAPAQDGNHREGLDETVGDIIKKAEDAVEDTAGFAGDLVVDAGDTVVDIVVATKNGAEQAGEAAMDGAQVAGDAAADGAKAAGKSIADAAQEAGDGVHDAAKAAGLVLTRETAVQGFWEWAVWLLIVYIYEPIARGPGTSVKTDSFHMACGAYGTYW